MNKNLTHKKRIALIVAQTIGFIFGLVFAISEISSHESFWEILCVIILAPVLAAGLLRFVVRAYQFAKVRFGTKMQDSEGNYVIVEKPIRGILAAIVALYLPIGVVSSCGKASPLLGDVVLVLLILVGAFFCYLDIRYMVQHKREKKDGSVTL